MEENNPSVPIVSNQPTHNSSILLRLIIISLVLVIGVAAGMAGTFFYMTKMSNQGKLYENQNNTSIVEQPTVIPVEITQKIQKEFALILEKESYTINELKESTKSYYNGVLVPVTGGETPPTISLNIEGPFSNNPVVCEYVDDSYLEIKSENRWYRLCNVGGASNQITSELICVGYQAGEQVSASGTVMGAENCDEPTHEITIKPGKYRLRTAFYTDCSDKEFEGEQDVNACLTHKVLYSPEFQITE